MAVTQESVRGDPRNPVYGVGGTFYLSADNDNLTNATWTQVPINTAEMNVGLTFSSNTVTIPIKGLYKITGVVQFNDVVADKDYRAAIYINDTIKAQGVAHASAVLNLTAIAEKMFLLDKDDTVKLYAQSNSGDNTVDLTGGLDDTYLSLVLIALK